MDQAIIFRGGEVEHTPIPIRETFEDLARKFIRGLEIVIAGAGSLKVETGHEHSGMVVEEGRHVRAALVVDALQVSVRIPHRPEDEIRCASRIVEYGGIAER